MQPVPVEETQSDDVFQQLTVEDVDHSSDVVEEAVDPIDDEDDPDIVEWFSGLGGLSTGNYHPFQSKIFALLFFLVNSPHPMMGITVPSLASVKTFQRPDMREPVWHVNRKGTPFYSIPLESIVSQCIGQPHLSSSLMQYPVEGLDTYTEMYHGEAWRSDVCCFSPMVKLLNGTSVFLKDCVHVTHHELGTVTGVVEKFYHWASSKDILAHIETLLNVVQFQHMVPDTTVTHLSSDSLISYGKINVPVSDIIGLATPPVHIVQLVSSGSGFARMNRQTTRKENPDTVCAPRTKAVALQQIAQISTLLTEALKVEMRKRFGLQEDYNPLLYIPADLYLSIPVEVLHTLLLGSCKHFLKEVMPNVSAVQKREIQARVRAFNTSGFSTKLHGSVCYYYQSFVGRDFKGWMQMALFIISPYLSDGQKEVLVALSKAFKIAYCDFFKPILLDEWKRVCQGFVSAAKQHMPSLLEKQKMHLILHLVDSMVKFGRCSAFSAERFESFNSYVRTYNVFGNRLGPSRDIAKRFCNLQHLRHICHGGNAGGSMQSDIVLGMFALTDEVVEHRAIVSQSTVLVNSGDYVELVVPQCNYGILLAIRMELHTAWFKAFTSSRCLMDGLW
eukprot:Em0001g135a